MKKINMYDVEFQLEYDDGDAAHHFEKVTIAASDFDEAQQMAKKIAEDYEVDGKLYIDSIEYKGPIFIMPVKKHGVV